MTKYHFCGIFYFMICTLRDGAQVECMTGAELDQASKVTPSDVIRSLMGYTQLGGDINATVYDRAIDRSVPPFRPGQLQTIIDLCSEGIASNHYPKTPIDHTRSGEQQVGITTTQSHFAALLGASSVRLAVLRAS